MTKTIIGGKEYVTIFCGEKERKVLARIDTGATKSSIDKSLARNLCIGPILHYKKIRSAAGMTKRGIVLVRVRIAGRTFKMYFTVADRKHMKYQVLIGRNILKRGFLVDVSRKPR
ncbi:MAG: RimK/LysX family protein [Burkholderiales bacterium]